MSDFFSIEIRGLNTLKQKVANLPTHVRDYVLRRAADYGLQVLRETQPNYSYVSRAQAYQDAPAGPGWFSDKQRRYVMGAIKRGEIAIPYRRTGNLANSWSYSVTYGEGADGQVQFTNSAPYAPYVQGFAAQSAHERMVGWRNVKDIVANLLTFRAGGFRDAVRSAITEAIGRYWG